MLEVINSMNRSLNLLNINVTVPDIFCKVNIVSKVIERVYLHKSCLRLIRSYFVSFMQHLKEKLHALSHYSEKLD